MTFQGDGCPPVQPSRRQRARRRAVAIAVPTGVALGAGAVFAYGAIPASDGTIGACYSTQGGAVRFVDDASQCRTGGDGTPGENFIKFNQTGPQGLQGPAGAAGPQGAAGPAGPAGAPGGVGGPAPQPGGALGLPARDRRDQGRVERLRSTRTRSRSSPSAGARPTRARTARAAAAAPARSRFQDLHFTKPSTSPRRCSFKRARPASTSRRRRSSSASPAATRATTDVIKLTDILVSSYKTGPSEAPTRCRRDQFSLNFTKIEFSYKPQLSNGALGAPVTATYDLKAAKK